MVGGASGTTVTGQLPSVRGPWPTVTRSPDVMVASAWKLAESTRLNGALAPLAVRSGTAEPPVTRARSALPEGTDTVGASAPSATVRSSCGGRRVYSGGLSQRSRCGGAAAIRPMRSGVTAAWIRSHQSPRLPTAPMKRRRTRAARSANGSRRATFGCGPFSRSRSSWARARSWWMRQTAASVGSVPGGRRSTTVSSGRWASALSRSSRRRAAVTSGRRTRRRPNQSAAAKPIARAASTRPWPHPGSIGSTLNSASARNRPATIAAGHSPGQSASHTSVARARPSRRPAGSRPTVWSGIRRVRPSLMVASSCQSAPGAAGASIQGGSRSAAIISAMVWRGRTTANRSARTITSARSGRAL